MMRPWALLPWLVLAPFSAYGAWTQPQGRWFTANSLSLYETRHFYDDAGHQSTQPPFRKYELNAYAEYGFRDDLTLGFNGFLHKLESENPATTTRNFGLADVELFARKKLWDGHGAAVSMQPLVKLPSLYRRNRNPLSGTDDFDLELRLLAGYGFDTLGHHHYARLDVAYRHRLGAWRDQLKIDATLGWKVSEQFTIMPQLFFTQRVEGTARNTALASAVNDYDLLKGQITLLYDLNEQTTLQIGGFSHLRARNTGGGGGWLLGIWHRF